MARRFGVELEYSLERVTLDQLEQSLKTAVQTHHSEKTVSRCENPRTWTIKTEHCGAEITTPILEASEVSMNMLKDVVDSIRRSHRGRNLVRRNCGLHVHIDVHDFTAFNIKNLIKIFYNFEDVLLKLQPPSRTGNEYCRKINNDNPSWIDSFDADSDHYYDSENEIVFSHSSGLNLQGINETGDIEVRYGAGTSRGVKVMGWVRLLLALVDIAKGLDTPIICNKTNRVEDLTSFIASFTLSEPWLENQKQRCITWTANRANEIRTRSRN